MSGGILLAEAIDSVHQNVYAYGPAVLDPDTGHIRTDLVERFDCIGDDLILHLMEVLPDHRGRDIGLGIVVGRLCLARRHLGGACDAGDAGPAQHRSAWRTSCSSVASAPTWGRARATAARASRSLNPAVISAVQASLSTVEVSVWSCTMPGPPDAGRDGA